MLVLWPYSCVTLYQGARTLFAVRRGRAVLWFLALPLCFWCVSLGAVAVYALATGLAER